MRPEALRGNVFGGQGPIKLDYIRLALEDLHEALHTLRLNQILEFEPRKMRRFNGRSGAP